MKRSIKVSAIMHKLLIEKRMDGFSVVELRDASLSNKDMDPDLDAARKVIYRQILRFKKNNWLKSKGTGRNKRYFQTELFKSLQPIPKPVNIEVAPKLDYSVLEHECNHYKGELEITLGEIEEYQSLSRRFPELEPKLGPFLGQAKERSANLLGKVNVLTNVLNTLSESNQQC